MFSIFTGKRAAAERLARQRIQEQEGMIHALNRSQAIIEFDPQGRILNANQNFLDALGYTLAEVKGQHHAMFVPPEYRQSPEYRSFWEKLGRGEFDAGKYKRLGKGGREIWIQATYNPILDITGRPYKIVKFASDITAEQNQANEQKGRVSALGRSQAVIEFKLDGTILSANANFCAALGYAENEIVGRHHSMFADPEFAKSRGISRLLGQAGPRRVRRRQIQAHRQGRPRNLDPGQLQPDFRPERQAHQGHQVRHRHHRSRNRSPTNRKAASMRSAGPRR